MAGRGLTLCFLLGLSISSAHAQGLLEGLGRLLGGGAGGPGGPGGGADLPQPGGGGPGRFPPPGSGGFDRFAGEWGHPRPRGGWGPQPGGGGQFGAGGPPPPGGPGPLGGGPGGPEGQQVLNLGGLLHNAMDEINHVVQTGKIENLDASLRRITEGTGFEQLYERLSQASKNFLAPQPTENGIPPHVLRRIIRFCSRPEHHSHPKCQGHPEWQSADTLPGAPKAGQIEINDVGDIFDLLQFRLPPVPQLAMTNILTNVPEVLKSLVPPPKHELAAKFKDQMLRRCKGQECVKQPVQALNMRASIAEQEATVRRLLGGSSRSQADIDRDIETQMARTHQLKKAIMTKAGLGTNVEPINDGVFQNDILLTTDQADALINAVQNDDPGSVPVQGRAGGRRKRSALFFEEQLVKKWPAGAIPYVFDSSLSASEQATIQQAVDEIQSKTCVKFQKLAARPAGNHIFYVKYNANYFCGLSNIGVNSNGNPVYLTFSCANNPKGVAIHETLHALGLAHEHVRSDRDDHITVNWENVDPQNYQFFGINDAKLFTSYGVTYDYGSIMHYANTVAAKFPGSVTMIAKENGPAMGQRKGMSQRDVEIVNKMYCKPESCKDENVYCGIWANRDKCRNEPTAWIFQHCKKSCGYC